MKPSISRGFTAMVGRDARRRTSPSRSPPPSSSSSSSWLRTSFSSPPPEDDSPAGPSLANGTRTIRGEVVHSRTSTHITSPRKRGSRVLRHANGDECGSRGGREITREISPRVRRRRDRPRDLITVAATVVVVVVVVAAATAAARRNVRTCGATAERIRLPHGRSSDRAHRTRRARSVRRRRRRRRRRDAPSHAVHRNYPNTNAAKRGIIGTVHATPFSFFPIMAVGARRAAGDAPRAAARPPRQLPRPRFVSNVPVTDV